MTRPGRDANTYRNGVEVSHLLDEVNRNIVLLKSSPDSHVCTKAFNALMESHDARAVIPIVHAFPQLSFEGERKIKEQLAGFGKTAVLPLIQLLQSDETRMRQVALELLGDIGDERGFLSVAQTLKDDNWVIRHSAVLALGHFQPSQTFSLLMEALQDKDVMVRNVVISVLSYRSFLQDERATAALIDARNDPDGSVRGAILGALSHRREARAIPFYLEAMHDEHHVARSCAARALGKIQETLAIPLLIRALTDVNWQVQESAGNALLQFGDKDALAIGLLTNSLLSVSTKLDTLTDLVNIRFRFNEIRLDYRSRSVEHYCWALLHKEITPTAREAVHAVQEEIIVRRDRQVLLRASESDVQAQELLRGAEKSPNVSQAEEMLRASEKTEGSPPPRPSWLARLLRRQ